MEKMYIVRIITSAALIALGACSPYAGAQAGPADFAGTWAFRTEPFTIDPATSISGAAIVTEAAQGHYTIRLIANQFAVQAPAQPVQAKPGEALAPHAQLIAAHETCAGDLSGQQFTVACTLAEPLAHYTPDNFVLQTQNPDTLAGVISSGDDQAQVTFSRVR